jgi:abnormal spindle-like microcephaly-associated protein
MNSTITHLLTGEGDFVRHLGFLGYTVGASQSELDEFDYTVTNVATDLRDGVRLCKLVEILSHNHSLSQVSS